MQLFHESLLQKQQKPASTLLESLLNDDVFGSAAEITLSRISQSEYTACLTKICDGFYVATLTFKTLPAFFKAEPRADVHCVPQLARSGPYAIAMKAETKPQRFHC